MLFRSKSIFRQTRRKLNNEYYARIGYKGYMPSLVSKDFNKYRQFLHKRKNALREKADFFKRNLDKYNRSGISSVLNKWWFRKMIKGLK